MAGYTKLFSDIVDSSIWEEDPHTCKVWITLLSQSDADGYIRGSVGWLAGKSRVTNEQCALAISKFTNPDPRSRTPDNQGRRIEQLTDGWLILNYLVFRDRLSNDPKASATRERVRKHRERYNALRNVESVTSPVSASASASASESASESPSDTAVPSRKELAAAALVSSAIQNEVNDVTTGKAATITEPTREAIAELPSHLQTARMQNKWQVWQNVRKGFKAPKSWLTLFNEQIEWFSKFDEPTAFEILSASIRNGWQGLFEPKGTNAKTNTQPRNSGHGGNSTSPDYSKGF